MATSDRRLRQGSPAAAEASDSRSVPRRGRWRTSLQTRLVVYFLLLSGLVATLATTLVFAGVRETLRRAALRDLMVVATLEKEQIHQWLESGRQDLHLLTRSPTVAALARRLLGSPSPADRAAARGVLAELFEHTLTIKPSVAEILLLSADGGEVLLSSSPKHEGEYRVRDTFFTAGLQGTHIQGVYPSPVTLRPTLTISAPLKDHGVTLGVLALHMDLELLVRVIGQPARLGASGESYLVDKYGGFVSATRFGRHDLDRGLKTHGVEQALVGVDGTALYENYDGVPVIGAFCWISEVEAALLVEVTQEEALAPARRLARRVLAVSATLVLALSVGTFLVARRIAAPVERITAAAVQVGYGDLDTVVPVPTEDEIGTLARTFNGMTVRLRQLYRRLESEIAERQLAQEERERFVAELEAKNAELEQFTYTVSHDLKSPLVTVSGFLALLERDLKEGNLEQLDGHFRHISQAAATMKQTLDELLELSRVGRVVNPPEACSLSELAREALAMVAGEIAERGVEVDLQPDMPVALVDRVRLREVFLNLIANAVKFFGDQPRPRLEIGASTTGELACYVRDNGIGIPAPYQAKVFGLFERLRPEIEGTGIGLALVKRIIEVHGGRVWVESEGEGKGSTFWFTLPRTR